MRNEHIVSATSSLRERAFMLLQKSPPRPDLKNADEKAQELILELELHQIELELQNEELRMAQEKAELFADRYIEFFDFAPFGYYEFTDKGEILELNLRGAELLGGDRSSLKKSCFGFFVTEDTKQTFNLFLEKIFQERKKVKCELILTPHNGEPIYVFLSGIPIYKTQHCIVNVVDITQNKIAQNLLIANKELAFQNEEKEKRAAELVIANKELAFQNEEKEKRAAELIVAKEKAQENDRLKSAFLANMSHEIRTPMNAILGFSDLLKNFEVTGEQSEQYISLIEQGGERLLNLINDLVEISRIESGQMELVLSKCNIREQVEFIYNLFSSEVTRKGMQIFIHGELTAYESNVMTDREKIYEILTNLVKNAIKYSDHGSIEIGYRLRREHHHPELIFYVKDTGIGILPENIKFIFDRFRQGSESNTRSYEGAGLGLSISKAYVEMLGGRIWVKSEIKRGSTFYFAIPYFPMVRTLCPLSSHLS